MRIVASRSSDIRIEISGLRTSSPFRFTAPIPEFATCSLVGEEANNTITLAQQPVLQFFPEEAISPEKCQSIQCIVDEFSPSKTSKHRLHSFFETSLLESYITPALLIVAPEFTSVKPVKEPCFIGSEIYFYIVSYAPIDHTLLFLKRPITPRRTHLQRGVSMRLHPDSRTYIPICQTQRMCHYCTS